MRGTLAFALIGIADRDPKELQDLVDDINIYVIQPGFITPTIKTATVGNLESAKNLVPTEIYEQIAGLVEKFHLSNKPITLTYCPKNLYPATYSYTDEPELLLWDQELEIASKIYRPLTQRDKSQLKQEIASKPFSYSAKEELFGRPDTAFTIHLYQQHRLMRGSIPGFFAPKQQNLAKVLELLALATRHGKEHDVDDSLIFKIDERLASGASVQIVIPPDYQSSEPFRQIDVISQNKASQGGAIDELFLQTLKQKHLEPLLQKKFPHLAKLVERINLAGGIRKFIAQEYGDAYLDANFSKFETNSSPLKDSLLSKENQLIILRAWNAAPPAMKNFFNGLKEFVSFCQELILNSPENQKVNIEELVDQALEALAIKLIGEDGPARVKGYEILRFLIINYQGGGFETSSQYNRLKELLKEKLLTEDKRLKKQIIDIFRALTQSGQDLALVSDLVAIIKQESNAIEAGQQAGKLLSPTGMRTLELVLALDNQNARRAIYDLIIHPNLDSRLKKLCLKRLNSSDNDDVIIQNSLVRNDLQKDAREINWTDYNYLSAILKITSTSIRERLAVKAVNGAVKARANWNSIEEAHEKIAPKLPIEFFLSLLGHKETGQSVIKAWENFISAIKSNKMHESFLYNLSIILNKHPELLELLTEKLITTEKPSREYIDLVNRIIRKIDFLYSWEKSIGRCNCGSCPPSKLEGIDIKNLLQQSQTAAILEADLNRLIVESLFKITNRNDLTVEKVTQLFQAWEDPEPIFTYLARMASGANGDYQRTLNLMAEALSHMDPPTLEQWKEWRYFTNNDLLTKQLEGLTPEQIEAYAQDQFVDLGEVMVSLLPSDKPKRIRDLIIHNFTHDIENLNQGVLRTALLIKQAVEHNHYADFIERAQQDLSNINSMLNGVERLHSLFKDLETIDNVKEELGKYQKTETGKREKLISLGFTGNETREDIQNIINQLKAQQGNANRINMLVSLKPNPLPEWVTKFLDQYQLTITASDTDFKQVEIAMRQELEQLTQGHEIQLVRRIILEGKAAEAMQLGDLYKAATELKAAKLILQLSLLTPQLIAFNRISSDKKKASLSRALEDLTKIFANHQPILIMIGQIKNIIDETSYPIGKDYLALIFTDNPLVMLTVGNFPKGAESCQNYQNGDLPLGANVADGMTKICLAIDLNKLPSEIRNELDQASDQHTKLQIFQKNTQTFLQASVGRRLTKIVTDNTNQSKKLFLEPVYTQLDRNAMVKTLNAFAASHIQPQIGIELVRGGGKNQITVPESRNHIQYEDGENGGPGGAGAGLGKKYGSYTMPAQPLTAKDYMLV